MTGNEIKIEEFSLKFGKYDACDIPFTAKLGRRTIKSYISNWSVNFDLIRHQLEGLTFYPHRGEVDICYEDDPTRFVFSHCYLHDKMPDGRINSSLVMHLQIVPNCFTQVKPIDGYCDPEQVIRAMYEAFLHLGKMFVTTKKYDSNDWRFSCGFEIYNTLKSGIVERFLTISNSQPELIKRQIIVNEIVTIRAGENTCGYLDDGSPIYVDDDDLICIKVFEAVKIDGVRKWLKQKKETEFDSEKWNQQGLRIAKQIRLYLSKEYDVWYESSNKKQSFVFYSNPL